MSTLGNRKRVTSALMPRPPVACGHVRCAATGYQPSSAVASPRTPPRPCPSPQGHRHTRPRPPATVRRADDEDLLDALGSRYGAGAIGDDHLAAGCGAAVGRPRPHRLHRADMPAAARPRAAPVESDSEGEDGVGDEEGGARGGPGGESGASAAARLGLVGADLSAAATLRATRSLPAQARLAGFELLPGADGRAPTVVQRVPGLLTPAERRRMLELEVAQGKALRLRRKVLGARARREALLRARHPVGALGLGSAVTETDRAATDPATVGAAAAGDAESKADAGASADAAAGAGIAGSEPSSYAELRGARGRAAAAAASHAAARRVALMQSQNSVARRGYDFLAPSRGAATAGAMHPEADSLGRSLRAGGAAIAAGASRPAAPLAALQASGDYRAAAAVSAAAVEAPPQEGGVKVLPAKGRVAEPWTAHRDTHERLFPAPADKTSARLARTQRLVDERTRGRDFDIVTGQAVAGTLAPSRSARATRGAGESASIAPGAAPGMGRSQREAHPSLASTRKFVER